ncbi:tyrosine-type recombinase/integrase [Rhodanobacter sp. B2A1Ga4]|uniref:tyrosine-type recombinase/integrase n=1 Tax=Rhodanobacter sp. B2A1Ga4 TaxID=2778647 RepID=UPI001B369681|nr:tyrosine-type recombinase/integrase [Rhodanobacter sp. B2A1Ga4]
MRAWIQSKSGRAKLPQRNDPYWGAPVDRGLFVGYRSMAHGGNWIARWRDEDGKQNYHPLGAVNEDNPDAYMEATKAARAWLKRMRAGVRSTEVVTVADACREYVQDRRSEKGEATAIDAEQRFARTVYDSEVGKTLLDRITTKRITEWRDALSEPDDSGKVLGRASVNRTLTALKAALNLAVRNRNVTPEREIEWRLVKPLNNASDRRELFLDLGQRRALLAAAEGDIRHLIEAAMLTGARPGELGRARCRQFDPRTGTMVFDGKTGKRSVRLTPAAATLFKAMRKGKLPEAWLFDNAGAAWDKHVWNEHVQKAAESAELPPGVCLYTLRHSFITEAITGGLSPLEVARMVGTSLAMIDKHYGHLAKDTAVDRLARVALI